MTNETENHWSYKHIVLTLRGKFKGESGKNYHLVVVTANTKSGLCIGPWVRRALVLKVKMNLIRGFSFVDVKGKILFLKDMEVDIIDRILDIQNKYLELIGVRADVYKYYGLSRSFRRVPPQLLYIEKRSIEYKYG